MRGERGGSLKGGGFARAEQGCAERPAGAARERIYVSSERR